MCEVICRLLVICFGHLTSSIGRLVVFCMFFISSFVAYARMDIQAARGADACGRDREREANRKVSDYVNAAIACHAPFKSGH